MLANELEQGGGQHVDRLGPDADQVRQAAQHRTAERLVDADPDGVPRYDAVAVRLVDAVDWSYVGEMEWVELSFEAQGPDDPRPRPSGRRRREWSATERSAARAPASLLP